MIRNLLPNNRKHLSFYSFFTRYSLMEDYGFGSGLMRRLFRKVLPKVPREDTLEYFLLKSGNSIPQAIELLDIDSLQGSPVADELNLSIKALCTKIASFGLDNEIQDKFYRLQIDTHPFEILLDRLEAISGSDKDKINEVFSALDTVKSLVVALRRNKNKIGTNFHLTASTRKVLEYIGQAEDLINLRLNIDSKRHWEEMLRKHIVFSKTKNSIRKFILRHADLVALEIVEHTSTKGEKYIAESKAEYWKFFNKSLLGGSIISVFALLKIVFDSFQLSQLQNAFLFSCNYALCFILVKQFGGIIATKQPAVTASTIAKGIGVDDELKISSIQNITALVRKVIRSQFISILGNFLMALSFACLLTLIFKFFEFNDLISAIDPKYLIKNTTPSVSLVSFAAIAGCFLALSGLISGYIDNKIVASNIIHRIRNSFSFIQSERLTKFIEKKSGALIGNICLGFFLGSAFLLSNFLPFYIDIRHIAFSSANVGYAALNYDFNGQIILLSLFGALLIGFINFLVSFSITLFLALKSRGASFQLLPRLLFHVFKDFIRRPLDYFIVRGED